MSKETSILIRRTLFPPGGHTNTERGYLTILAERLKKELGSQESKDEGVSSDVEVLVSQKDQHPLQIV